MKNPHGVEPTRFMKRKESEYAIKCDPKCGPMFHGSFSHCDIYISSKCRRGNNCYIMNDGAHGYKCHPKYKSSLFVTTNVHENRYLFSVLEYEVYSVTITIESNKNTKSTTKTKRKVNVHDLISDEIDEYYDMLEEDYV